MNIFKKDGRYFQIDESMLPEEARKNSVLNGLYAAVYTEFKGAVENPQYKNLDPRQRFAKLNEFAENWLKMRGLL